MVDDHYAFLRESGELEQRQRQIARQRVLAAAENILRDRFRDDATAAMEALVAGVAERKVHPQAAARDLIAHQEM